MTLSDLKQQILKEFEEKYSIEPVRSDLDYLHHADNAVSIQNFLSEALDRVANEMKESVELENGKAYFKAGESIIFDYSKAVNELNRRLDKFFS